MKLAIPIQAHGAEVTELTLRRPKGEDVAACGFPFSFTVGGEGVGTTVQPNAPAITALIARLADIPLSSARAMDFNDWMTAMGELFSFLGGSIPGPLSNGASTLRGFGSGTPGSPSA